MRSVRGAKAIPDSCTRTVSTPKADPETQMRDFVTISQSSTGVRVVKERGSGG